MGIIVWIFGHFIFDGFVWLNFQLASSSAGLKMGSKEIRKNQTLLCAPIMAETVDKMVINMDKAKQSGADLVEIRLDSLKSFNPYEDLKTLIKECPLPTLFTYRFTTGNSFMIKLSLHCVCVCVCVVLIFMDWNLEIC